MKLESFHSAEDKRRWKVVRRDDYTDLPGEIIAANDETGDCCMSIKVPGQDIPETKSYAFGPMGIKIVARR